jgi:hypothetical protein
VGSQSHTVKSANDYLEMIVKEMSSKKEKIENAAEKTGEAIGKEFKKGVKATNDFGKGLKKGLKKK